MILADVYVLEVLNVAELLTGPSRTVYRIS